MEKLYYVFLIIILNYVDSGVSNNIQIFWYITSRHKNFLYSMISILLATFEKSIFYNKVNFV